MAQDAAACAQEFHANACAFPIPFLKEQCGLWRVCMDSDASHILKSRIVVRLVAELLSEFVEGFFGRLSFKTCVSATSLNLLNIYVNVFQIFFSVVFVFRNWGNY
jgi:hypothetical protein